MSKIDTRSGIGGQTDHMKVKGRFSFNLPSTQGDELKISAFIGNSEGYEFVKLELTDGQHVLATITALSGDSGFQVVAPGLNQEERTFRFALTD